MEKKNNENKIHKTMCVTKKNDQKNEVQEVKHEKKFFICYKITQTQVFAASTKIWYMGMVEQLAV